jgi:uncharacterized coiled-coil protein SlyX
MDLPGLSADDAQRGSFLIDAAGVAGLVLAWFWGFLARPFRKVLKRIDALDLRMTAVERTCKECPPALVLERRKEIAAVERDMRQATEGLRQELHSGLRALTERLNTQDELADKHQGQVLDKLTDLWRVLGELKRA